MDLAKVVVLGLGETSVPDNEGTMDIQRDVEHVPKLIDCSDRVMSEAPADFAELTATVAALKENVAFLTTTMATVVTQIAKLVDTIADVRRTAEPQIADISRALISLDSRLASLHAKVADIHQGQIHPAYPQRRPRESVTWKSWHDGETR